MERVYPGEVFVMVIEDLVGPILIVVGSIMIIKTIYEYLVKRKKILKQEKEE